MALFPRGTARTSTHIPFVLALAPQTLAPSNQDSQATEILQLHMAINNTSSDANMAPTPPKAIIPKTTSFIQSENHRDLLDIVDKLRSRGVSHYVDLPQIIVCGNQSSGKSATLESLGNPLPHGRGPVHAFCYRVDPPSGRED